MKPKNVRPLISSAELLGKAVPVKTSQRRAEDGPDEIARWTDKLKNSLASNDISSMQSVVGTMTIAGPELSDFVQKGQKKKRRGREWHEERHGTDMEKQARWSEHQAVVNAVRAQHPEWSWAKVKATAAAQCGVNARTIERHCIDPRL